MISRSDAAEMGETAFWRLCIDWDDTKQDRTWTAADEADARADHAYDDAQEDR